MSNSDNTDRVGLARWTVAFAATTLVVAAAVYCCWAMLQGDRLLVSADLTPAVRAMPEFSSLARIHPSTQFEYRSLQFPENGITGRFAIDMSDETSLNALERLNQREARSASSIGSGFDSSQLKYVSDGPAPASFIVYWKETSDVAVKVVLNQNTGRAIIGVRRRVRN